MQRGSLAISSRKEGPAVWQFRWSEKDLHGARVQRKRVINWGARANQDTPELLPDYEPSVGAVANALKSYWGKEVSAPAKVAQVVLRLAASDRLPAHLLIGSDAVRFAAEAEKTRAAEAAQWREVSLSTDVASSTALPAMRF